MSQHAASLTNHNAEAYNTNASFVYSAQYTTAVLGLLDAQPGERIVDLGCGTGELTLQIADKVGESGLILGLDSSEDMLVKAKGNTGDKVHYLQADIQKLPSTLDPSLEGTFDAVFSSAVLHWTKDDPAGVVEGIKWLLKPGGRVAFEFGGFGNAQVTSRPGPRHPDVGIRAAIHQVLRARGIDPIPLDPWYFPTAEQYSRLLRAHGLDPNDNIALFPRPTALPGDLQGWLHTFARKTFFVRFDTAEQDQLIHEVQEICRPDNYWNDAYPGSGVASGSGREDDKTAKDGWEIMYVRLRGSATKPI